MKRDPRLVDLVKFLETASGELFHDREEWKRRRPNEPWPCEDIHKAIGEEIARRSKPFEDGTAGTPAGPVPPEPVLVEAC
jgi:hypothetical protein